MTWQDSGHTGKLRAPRQAGAPRYHRRCPPLGPIFPPEIRNIFAGTTIKAIAASGSSVMVKFKLGVSVLLCGALLCAQGTIAIPNPTFPGNGFGRSVAGFTDINDDGYADVIVIEPGYGPTQNSNQGRLRVFSGKKVINSNSPGNLVLYTRIGMASGQSYISVGKAAGDFNGDGFNLHSAE